MSDYIELTGKYNSAKVFTYNIDNMTASQVIELCNQEAFADSKIRIMPDAHAGKGCVIGTTMTLTDKIVPNLVGVDIGCGLGVNIFEKDSIELDFSMLDRIIREHVPSGFSVNNQIQEFMSHVNITEMEMYDKLNNMPRILRAVGSLGGGNHFIEVNEDDNYIYLVVHTGSRNLGKQVAEYYQDLAVKQCLSAETQKTSSWIQKMKDGGKQHLIQAEMKRLKTERVRPDLAYLMGDAYWDYLHDMTIAQSYAHWNREQILDNICYRMGWEAIDTFQTIHNYIDMDYKILRKGAIFAGAGTRVIIPLNMRDGSIVAIGRGNLDWNHSAPHGAGRLMSRGKAKRELSLDDFENEMQDVWSTSVKQSTLDEAPMAYKPAEEIIDAISDVVEIISIIKPLYNFKAN